MIEQFILNCQQRVKALLLQWLPAVNSQASQLQQAMHYAVLNGGKRIRPILVYATGEALGIGWHKLDAAACAIELIHAYSLVHDDLPAMDNDIYRRGQLTCHKAFDEATAILVGDALQALAFEIISRDQQLTPLQRIKMVQILALAAGAKGMVGGQALDLRAVDLGVDLTVVELDHIHQHKTGALLRACIELALAVVEPSPKVTDSLLHYAQAIGLAFQVKDDVLDYIPAANQTRSQEPSYAVVFSIAQAEQRLAELYAQALLALENLSEQAVYLRGLADFIVNRSD